MRNLLERAYDFDMPLSSKQWVAQRLNNWGKAEVNLRYFTIQELAEMIVYEVNSRKREYVVKRLLSRYSKLRREAEWKHLQRMMEEKNERARNRAVSLSTCGGIKRDSDQTDLLE